MALKSQQYEICKKIKAILDADADIGGANLWRIRKLAFHQEAKWSAGYYVVPLTIADGYHETQQDLIEFRQLVAIIDPAQEGDLETGLETGLARVERVESIFRNRAGGDAPAGLMALNSVLTGDDRMAFQKSSVSPADRFVAAALAKGYDCSATIVSVFITTLRRNVSTLGA